MVPNVLPTTLPRSGPHCPTGAPHARKTRHVHTISFCAPETRAAGGYWRLWMGGSSPAPAGDLLCRFESFTPCRKGLISLKCPLHKISVNQYKNRNSRQQYRCYRFERARHHQIRQAVVHPPIIAATRPLPPHNRHMHQILQLCAAKCASKGIITHLLPQALHRVGFDGGPRRQQHDSVRPQ